MVWLTLLVFTLFLLMVFGLWISKKAAIREQQERELKAKLRKLKQLANDTEDIINVLKHYDGDPALMAIICEYFLSEHEQRAALAPHDRNITSDLERARLMCEELNAGTIEAEAPTNDRQIAELKRYAVKTYKLLRYMRHHHVISDHDMMAHTHRLRKKVLTLEVEAYLNQGEKSHKEEDHISAANYYKHAKDLLLSSDISYDGKTQEIKRISKLISGIFASEEDKKEDSEA
ncbi:hypothetical protein [Gynuella sp.]|uniref:hypothetical protein n=1 Tax=Gynuella sp. TaxID=2969146 RepID=UPI003D0BA312